MSGDGGGRGRALVAVLILQVVIAGIFIALVATDSIPLPEGTIQIAPAAGTVVLPRLG